MDLALLSFDDDIVPEASEDDVCCGTKMVYRDPQLICSICAFVRVPDDSYCPSGKIAVVNTKINIKQGSNTRQMFGASAIGPAERAEEAYRAMVEVLPELDTNAIRKAADLFSEALVFIGLVKQDNRRSLMAACIYYIAIENGEYFDRSDLAERFQLKVKGISAGEKKLQYWAIWKRLNININLNTVPALVRTNCRRVGILEYAPLVQQIVDYMIVNFIQVSAQNKTKVVAAILYVHRAKKLPDLDLTKLCKAKIQTFNRINAAFDRHLVSNGRSFDDVFVFESVTPVSAKEPEGVSLVQGTLGTDLCEEGEPGL
jgi:hypothetical protein